ncbi:MAG: NAD(P)H-dependent oxidoreductase [Humidesulfovibrio sp.]|uniref:NAD(P)H-dependent oxidoreductase n=1 Tax=Humidesulfovibrio sp. TaxID=2910988 RepID=UPI0027F117C8|nr:NAD(P)H-dependent oxidoreductase [Humidesulfovibrio sp.]MDQ7833760.1 NAD(P)H-dependent oxidoreductase [Humidesulfovibrio sp.]
MRVSVILGHPDPKSLNHAIAAAAVNTLRELGHEVRFHDLQAEGFDPVLPAGEAARDAELPPLVALHCAEIAEADGLILMHPNWWGQPPAVLKGWVDRVLRPGVAYEFLPGDGGEGVPVGLLKPMTALVLNTSNTLAAREQAVFGDPLERLWADCILRFCGVGKVVRRMFGVVCTSTAEQRHAWLAEVAELVRREFPA